MEADTITSDGIGVIVNKGIGVSVNNIVVGVGKLLQAISFDIGIQT
jgi:hypothetical protein